MNLPPQSVTRVLIVEDDAAIRRFVRQALEDAGYQVNEAEGLRRGLIESGWLLRMRDGSRYWRNPEKKREAE